jgi:hypothetical protein
MTIPVWGAFDLWRRSRHGGLSIIIGAISFCKTPSNGESPAGARVARRPRLFDRGAQAYSAHEYVEKFSFDAGMLLRLKAGSRLMARFSSTHEEKLRWIFHGSLGLRTGWSIALFAVLLAPAAFCANIVMHHLLSLLEGDIAIGENLRAPRHASGRPSLVSSIRNYRNND